MSEELPSGETGFLRDPAELPRPALWPKPEAGTQPVPVHGREQRGQKEEVAERRLPFAWAGVALLIASVLILGLAVARLSWLLAIAGLVVGAAGAGVTLYSRIMDAATIGQSVKDDE
jgi:hypothetical protein